MTFRHLERYFEVIGGCLLRGITELAAARAVIEAGYTARLEIMQDTSDEIRIRKQFVPKRERCKILVLQHSLLFC